MFEYAVKQFVYGFSVIWGVASLIFFLFNVLPADSSRQLLGQRSDISTVESIRRDLGLDLPVYKQYFLYLNDLSPISILNPKQSESHLYESSEKYYVFYRFSLSNNLNLVVKIPYLRKSYQSRKNVVEIISDAFPGTAVLATFSIGLAIILGISIGIICAQFQDTWLDRTLLTLSVSGMSMPSFVAAILISWLFAYILGDITGLPLNGSLFEIDVFRGETLQIRNLILPSITLGIRPLSVVVQLTRNSVAEVKGKDFVRTAKAKGLSPVVVMTKHVLSNGLNPVVTAISGWFASLLAGAVFVEMVFGWYGIGQVMLGALNAYDLPLVSGIVIFISLIFVTLNLITDFIYKLIDPRVRLS